MALLGHIRLYLGHLRFTVHQAFVESVCVWDPFRVKWAELRSRTVTVCNMLVLILILPNRRLNRLVILQALLLLTILIVLIAIMIVMHLLLLDLAHLGNVDDVIVVLGQDSLEAVLPS